MLLFCLGLILKFQSTTSHSSFLRLHLWLVLWITSPNGLSSGGSLSSCFSFELWLMRRGAKSIAVSNPYSKIQCGASSGLDWKSHIFYHTLKNYTCDITVHIHEEALSKSNHLLNLPNKWDQILQHKQLLILTICTWQPILSNGSQKTTVRKSMSIAKIKRCSMNKTQ